MRAKGLIRAWGSVCAATLLASCASITSGNPLVCRGVITAAATQTLGSRSLQFFSKPPEDNEIIHVECEYGDDPQLGNLCQTILAHSSWEFVDQFAYDVADCVAAHGHVTRLTTVDDHPTGLNDHPHNLESMDGRLGRTDVTIRSREDGFILTFHRS